jgi:shikimate kinase
MMGAGKSSVGRALADMTGRTHMDTDRILQHRLGRPIPQLFSIYGETAFRDHETSVLKGIEPGAHVISTGGGIVLREANWAEMRRLGLTIFLDVSPEILEERLRASKKRRPLLEVEDWEERMHNLLQQRMPLYEKADIRVKIVDAPLEQCASTVLDAVRSFTT